VIRTAETWTLGSVLAALVVLAAIVGIITAAFYVTRDR
jgi:predicted outer membrane lipoprotein